MELRLHPRGAALAGDPGPRVPRELRASPRLITARESRRPRCAECPGRDQLDHDQAWPLTDADRISLDAILAASPELAAVTARVGAFAVIMNERRGQKRLETWMINALATGEPALRSFVTGLRADQDAVTPASPSSGAPALSKATSTASRCSNDRCTAAPDPTCSAAASSLGFP
jgi:hypothetical protein